jgi:hypothetical protein
VAAEALACPDRGLMDSVHVLQILH